MAWDEQHEAEPSSTMSTEDDAIRPSGLRWLRSGTARPGVGRELKNAKLAMALRSKTAFTKAEWEAFGITDLRKTDFIEGGGEYFQPDVTLADLRRLHGRNYGINVRSPNARSSAQLHHTQKEGLTNDSTIYVSPVRSHEALPISTKHVPGRVPAMNGALQPQGIEPSPRLANGARASQRSHAGVKYLGQQSQSRSPSSSGRP